MYYEFVKKSCLQFLGELVPASVPYFISDKYDFYKKIVYNICGVSVLDIEIDKLTPCLEKASTGEIINTSYERVSEEELSSLKDWLFNWNDSFLKDSLVYKVLIEGDSRIQGLIAVKDEPENNAIYVKIAESAPHNKGKDKEYLGTGGHLFAIAALVSFEKGYGGFMYMDAKNKRLVDHYIEILNASFVGGVHPYRISVSETAAKKLVEFYDFKED